MKYNVDHFNAAMPVKSKDCFYDFELKTCISVMIKKLIKNYVRFFYFVFRIVAECGFGFDLLNFINETYNNLIISQ